MDVTCECSDNLKGEDSEGVRGLKALGVRDLHYRMCFLACSVVSANREERFNTTYTGFLSEIGTKLRD